ncbi:two-component system regulatory protein YycI [Heyndrickxia sporothermodurans]|uniref:Two-component system regulatory protein YycI n=1 Tax=Heyndrickxia sporothermodurans TaxID=46224 RepID=A0A150L6S6_9BACI|nr:two-component system regulatory protein YycI [Heyndrickxia sporothermodurans]KYD07975.1 hypothetical protein B4102_0609 [Heyndrickxia sporothermodurans]MBL5766590.1 two-component system regulatory protein YycI [Heyndrickxia sporothermodurans]MBL5770029.1 two-component system regulatory protein YycI [Heyndrickxia sporothermodurans]MBL5773706.1 two-component system regulatory protein YycI [Heyndrickxia sporothermodurans]MBL5777308.1 two-component system regulatory protein YycI [Heyndrickxia s
MDWNKTKTMFIIVFLILDIFLFVQFSRQYSDSKIEQLKEDPSLEDRLKEAEITYNISFPSESIKVQYISAKTKKFTEKEIKELVNQTVTIGPNKTSLFSTFKKPEKLNSSFDPIQLETFISENMLYGNQYKYWEYDKDKNVIIFYQTYEDKQFFKNDSGQLVLILNDKNEVVSYKQTILEKMEKRGGEKALPIMTAIGNLYAKNMIFAKSEVVKAELGYYTLIPQTESQMLVPTWHFVVKHGKVADDLFVNAIDGRVIPKNDKETETETGTETEILE